MANEKFKVDPKKASKEQMERAFDLLAKEEERKDKIKRGVIKGTSYKKYSELSDEQRAKVQAASARRLVRQGLIIEKAKAAGITVTEKEVDAEMAKRAKAKEAPTGTNK